MSCSFILLRSGFAIGSDRMANDNPADSVVEQGQLNTATVNTDQDNEIHADPSVIQVLECQLSMLKATLKPTLNALSKWEEHGAKNKTFLINKSRNVFEKIIKLHEFILEEMFKEAGWVETAKINDKISVNLADELEISEKLGSYSPQPNASVFFLFREIEKIKH